MGFFLGLAVSLPAGLVGGVIGLLTGTDVNYFDSGKSTAKVKRLKYLIKKHS